MTDEQLLSLIKKGGRDMEEAIDYLYNQHFKLIYQKVKNHKLTREQALDAYSDALIALKDNILKNTFKGDSRLSTYFISIFNRKCIDVLRKDATNQVYEHELPEHLKDNSAGIEDKLTVTVNLDRLKKLLNELSEICRNILIDWNEGYSMEEIAERNSLLNAHTARSKRYNCFQQLMQLVGR